ncbi:hypothetical protein LCGC14_1659880 [marine sediment metagenome]|uniref:LamG-like jellyroll fold domain-containing protein n=1 Tax=marine sediment metagenome TaxID=412755 RepID=A0A0F9KAA4_9ZZZZ
MKVAHWKLNDNLATDVVIDETGNNNGTLSDVGGTATTAAHSVDGVVDRALSFDGVDDVIACGSDSSIDNIWDSGGTAVVWMKADSDGEGNLGQMLDKVNWLLRMDSADTAALFECSWAGDDGQWSFTINGSVFEMIAVTYDSGLTTNDPIIYVNGESVTISEDSTPTGANRTSDAAENLSIGNNAGTTATFDGRLDNIMLFDSILSASEIRKLYRDGAVPFFRSRYSGNSASRLLRRRFSPNSSF